MNERQQTAEYTGNPAFRPKPDGSIDPAGEAGWFLQRERERRGMSLAMAAHALGIHGSHLDAIELGDLTGLPARNEALAMIGVYGKYLGLDPKPLLQHYSRFLPRPVSVAPRRGTAPKALSSAKIIPFAKIVRLATSPRGLTVVSSMAGMALILAVVGTMLTPQEEDVISGIDPLPTATLTQEADDGSTVSIRETPMTEDFLPAAAPARDVLTVDPAQPDSAFDDLGQFIDQQLGPAKIDPGVPPAAKTDDHEEQSSLQKQPSGKDGGRIVLKAAGSVWFRVEDARGNIVISQTLHKGESYVVPDRDDLVIIARDGGMISYEVDGVDQGPLGTPGEIVVGRSLSATKLSNRRG
jgi:cytoskeleton protein RodZ